MRDGPLVGVISSKFEKLPVGTRLYDYLWTSTGAVSPDGLPVIFGRYDKIVTPDDKEHRVCFALAMGAADNLRGWLMMVDSKSGALTVPFSISVIPVHRFSYE